MLKRCVSSSQTEMAAAPQNLVVMRAALFCSGGLPVAPQQSEGG
jgi:hypothetical protein